MSQTTQLPPLPLAPWLPAKRTLHLFTQVVGKIRLATAPPKNHWWHVALRVTPHGLSTGLLPHPRSPFEIELDLVEHRVHVRTPNGCSDDLRLQPGLSVASFHRELFARLAAFGIAPEIRAVPYDVAFATQPFAEDEEHAHYDPEAVARFGAVLRWIACVFERHAGRYRGKTSPVNFYWHSFDLAVTRFSGRPAPEREGADVVEREAYSHEVASTGFWPGDDRVPHPAFYGYAAPAPAGLTEEPLEPAEAAWTEDGGMALLDYDVVRAATDPAGAVLAFCDSVCRAAAARAGWTHS